MSQQEISLLLNETEMELSVIDIAYALKITTESVRRSLNKMHQYGEVRKRNRRIGRSKRVMAFWRIK